MSEISVILKDHPQATIDNVQAKYDELTGKGHRVTDLSKWAPVVAAKFERQNPSSSSSKAHATCGSRFCTGASPSDCDELFEFNNRRYEHYLTYESLADLVEDHPALKGSATASWYLERQKSLAEKAAS